MSLLPEPMPGPLLMTVGSAARNLRKAGVVDGVMIEKPGLAN